MIDGSLLYALECMSYIFVNVFLKKRLLFIRKIQSFVLC